VEHPVTELITGLDLVELQLRIATGERLPITQEDVAVTGHAIEARVYAEDSFAGFLPQAGTASVVRWPQRVRVDHALEPGQVVSTAYDPMLGKIIAYGSDRESARRALVDALDRTAILGLTTNVGFLRSLVAGSAFRDASIDTAWLDRTRVSEPEDDVARVFAAWASARSLIVTDGAETAPHPFQSDGWRSGAPPTPMTIDLDRPVVVDRHLGRVDDVEVGEIEVSREELALAVDGVLHRAVVDVRSDVTEVALRGQRFVFERPDVLSDHAVAPGDGAVVAPMPGTILDVRVANGDQVAAGQVLIVVEAMKMEAALRAPFAGTVGDVDASVGRPVALGSVLCVVVPEEGE
ncbi:MAG TPA: biotin/lipoyl-containing protein, partial [Microlunatus sp.]|nr:biotin/lipoyl-containing protein [Microlunatus sp.]